MSNVPETVFELPLFAKLSEKEKKLVRSEASLDICEAGRVFAHQGEYMSQFCLILHGGVSMVRKETSMEGTREVVDEARLGEFGVGHWFGELGALSNQPEPATIRSDTSCTFLVCDQALFKQLYKNKHFRGLVDETYRRVSLAVHLRVAPLFKGLTSEQLTALQQSVSLVEYEKGREIAAAGDPAAAIYLVRSGAISCVAPSGRIVGYYASNSSFGERALTDSPTWPGTYTAMTTTAVLKIPVSTFQTTFAGQPDVLDRLRRTAGYLLSEELGESTGVFDAGGELSAKQQQLEVMVGKQSVKGGEALVIDLAMCVRCNACVEACVSVHDDRVPRLSKTGSRVVSAETGREVTLATSCYNCEIPECMMACEYGAIRRDVQGLIRYVWDNCVGCQQCSNACPYGVISMTPPPPAGATEPKFKRHWFLQTIPFLGKRFRDNTPVKQELPEGDEGEKARGALRGNVANGKAIKCDLCAGLPFEACVYNCPTAAITRINPEKVLTGVDRRGLLPKH